MIMVGVNNLLAGVMRYIAPPSKIHQILTPLFASIANEILYCLILIIKNNYTNIWRIYTHLVYFSYRNSSTGSKLFVYFATIIL